jgi:hypothetical protein
MSKPTSITQFEIDAKITGAIHGELKRGTKAPDIGRKEIARLSDGVMDSFSPEAKKALVHAGVLSMVKRVLGEKIAEEIWKSGQGWSMPEQEIRDIAKRLKFESDADAFECLASFREAIPDMTREEAAEFPILVRFSPLFILQPDDATLGEITTRKAMQGNKLALSFLAWKEIA